MLTVFKQSFSKSLRIISFIFSLLYFSLSSEGQKKKGSLQNSWNIYLTLLRNGWNVSKFQMYSWLLKVWNSNVFVQFFHLLYLFINMYVVLTAQGSWNWRSHIEHEWQSHSRNTELPNALVIILCEWTVQRLTTQALDWTAWIKMTMGMLLDLCVSVYSEVKWR